jgi:hypothetical protein
MAAKTSTRRKIASQIAAIQRHNGPDDDRLPALRHQLLDEGLREYAEGVARTAPPLSGEQRARLASLLRSAADGGHAA